MVIRGTTPGQPDVWSDPYDVYGTELEVASLEDIVRSKRAADRPQDRHDVVILREIIRRREESGGA